MDDRRGLAVLEGLPVLSSHLDFSTTVTPKFKEEKLRCIATIIEEVNYDRITKQPDGIIKATS
jgi:hypothetical protein